MINISNTSLQLTLVQLNLKKKRHTIWVLGFFFSASPCFLFTTSSSFFSSQLSIVSRKRQTVSQEFQMLKNVVKLLFSQTTVLLCHFYILVYRMENKSGLYNEVFKISYAAHKIISSKVLETYRRKIGRELKRRLVVNVGKYRSFNLKLRTPTYLC